MGPKKAQKNRPLNVTDAGNKRIFVGLSWDPNERKDFIGRLQNILSGKKSYHDLDLSCFLYNKDKEFLDIISGKIGKIVDQSGGIYHSGDDKEGIDDGDDEQISVELARIDTSIHYIIFKASVESGHSVDEIDAPAIRMVDAYSSHPFIKIDLDKNEGAGKDAYIFATLYRDPSSPSQWSLDTIDEYHTSSPLKQWKERLIDFISKT